MKEFILSEVMDIIGGGTPKTAKPEYWNGDIPWLSVVDFGNDLRKVYETEKTITELGLNNSSTRILKKNQIIISARGTVGELAILGKDMAFNQSCYGLNAKVKVCTNEFLYYLLKYKISEIKRNSHGAVFDTITRSTFDSIRVNLPPIPTQIAIAEILSSLDDKIELNNKINQELEALAQALFKQWFIDFEFPNENGKPYKSSGGKMVESELGAIPKGWKYSNYGSVTKKENLKVRKSKEEINDVFSAIKTSELVLSEDYFTKQVFSKSIDNYYVVKKFWFAYNPSRINIGSIGLNKSKSGAVSPVYVVFSVENDMHFFIENHLKLENTKNEIVQKCSGTVRQSLNYESLSSISVVVPECRVINLYNNYWTVTSEFISKLKDETNELLELRDLILPKLISGEFQIAEFKSKMSK